MWSCHVAGIVWSWALSSFPTLQPVVWRLSPAWFHQSTHPCRQLPCQIWRSCPWQQAPCQVPHCQRWLRPPQLSPRLLPRRLLHRKLLQERIPWPPRRHLQMLLDHHKSLHHHESKPWTLMLMLKISDILQREWLRDGSIAEMWNLSLRYNKTQTFLICIRNAWGSIANSLRHWISHFPTFAKLVVSFPQRCCNSNSAAFFISANCHERIRGSQLEHVVMHCRKWHPGTLKMWCRSVKRWECATLFKSYARVWTRS